MRAPILILLLMTCACVSAHELPERVAVRMLVAVEADRRAVEIMVRVPLEALRDVDFPLTGPGYLQIEGAEAALAEAAGLWIVDEIRLRAGERVFAPERVMTRLALPANRAFDALDAARAHFAGPGLDPATRVFWRQALLDVSLWVPLGEGVDTADLRLDVALQHLGVETRVDLLLVTDTGEETALSFPGHVHGLAMVPGWRSVSWDFFMQGVLHILSGVDHLLFLVCLVLPLRRIGALVSVVTAFTVAHSITLAAAALGYAPAALWFPALVEAVIAASIVFLALENALLHQFGHRFAVAFVFGLFHGFGFSFALAESLSFAGGHPVLALASFNIGVEAGQIGVLLLLLPVLRLLLRIVASERVLVLLISLLVGHTAWHWMSDRLARLSGYW